MPAASLWYPMPAAIGEGLKSAELSFVPGGHYAIVGFPYFAKRSLSASIRSTCSVFPCSPQVILSCRLQASEIQKTACFFPSLPR